ncbi:MAG: PIG-L family deacetylase [Rhodoglobus sp.]
MKDRAQRVLIIVARPEDEATIFGATIATLVQRGTELIVLACSSSPENTELDSRVRDVLGITTHHVLREDGGRQLATLTARDLAAELAAAITSLKPDVVVSYAAIDSGSTNDDEALVLHDATALAAELAGVPFYFASAVPVDRAVAVSSATAIAFKRRAVEIYTEPIDRVENEPTASEYLRRYHRRTAVRGERSSAERVVLAVASTAIGALVGVVLTAVHQSTIVLFGARLPWGIIAALALTTALIVGLRLIYDTRVAPGFAALGMLAMAGLLATAMPSGTILIPANAAGYIWTFAPVLIVLVVVGWPRVYRQPAPASRDSIELNSPVKGADIS